MGGGKNPGADDDLPRGKIRGVMSQKDSRSKRRISHRINERRVKGVLRGGNVPCGQRGGI